MPLQRNPLGDAQPIGDSISQIGHGIMDPAIKFGNALQHPKDTIMGMLGMNPPVQHGADPDMVRQANESFIHPTPNPVVAPPRRKPMNQGY
jgi:hypothetical protein